MEHRYRRPRNKAIEQQLAKLLQSLESSPTYTTKAAKDLKNKLFAESNFVTKEYFTQELNAYIDSLNSTEMYEKCEESIKETLQDSSEEFSKVLELDLSSKPKAITDSLYKMLLLNETVSIQQFFFTINNILAASAYKQISIEQYNFSTSCKSLDFEELFAPLTLSLMLKLSKISSTVQKTVELFDGTSILGSTDETLLDIVYYYNGTYYNAIQDKSNVTVSQSVVSRLELPRILKDLRNRAEFLPPHSEPFVYKSATSGSCMLNPPKNPLFRDTSRKDIDFLNILGELAFTVDRDVVNLIQFDAELQHELFKPKFDDKGVMRHGIKPEGWNSVIDLYQDKKDFTFRWYYDSRVRSYAKGYQLNPQGCKTSKALLDFAEEVYMDETTLPALYRSLAVEWGIKANPKDLIAWGEDLIFPLMLIVTELKPNEKLGVGMMNAIHRLVFTDSAGTVEHCKNQLKSYKCVKVIMEILSRGYTYSGYTMELDASSSGMQIMGAVTGCKDTMLYTNLMTSDKQYQAYKVVLDEINKRLEDEDKIIPCRVKGENLSALDIVKKCTMTHYYNSGAKPKELLTPKQLRVFYVVLKTLFPGPEKYLNLINSLYDESKSTLEFNMSDKHKIQIVKKKQQVLEIKFEDKNCAHLGSSSFKYIYTTHRNTDDWRSGAPNITHNVDGKIVQDTVTTLYAKDIQCSHIFDCFVFSPVHLKEVVTAYHTSLANIVETSYLDRILSEMTGRTIKVPSVGTLSKSDTVEVIKQATLGIN